MELAKSFFLSLTNIFLNSYLKNLLTCVADILLLGDTGTWIWPEKIHRCQVLCCALCVCILYVYIAQIGSIRNFCKSESTKSIHLSMHVLSMIT